MGVLMAARSACERLRLSVLTMSGSGRERPISVRVT
jgi:hypothetical protein